VNGVFAPIFLWYYAFLGGFTGKEYSASLTKRKT
jgi:hypothetical protein